MDFRQRPERVARPRVDFKNGVTLFARADRVQNDELVEGGEVVTGFAIPHPVFAVSKVSAERIYDFIRTRNMKLELAHLQAATYPRRLEVRIWRSDELHDCRASEDPEADYVGQVRQSVLSWWCRPAGAANRTR